MSCSICCEDFNKSTRKPVQCAYCDFHNCVSCAKTYLLSTVHDPHCPNCKNGWNRMFLDTWFPKTFIANEYKKHRENVLMDREKSLLPDTQPYVNRIIEGRAIDKRIAELEIEKLRIIQLINNERIKLQHLANEPIDPSKRREFIKKCPVDDCRGFLSSRWKCEICDHLICKDCNQVKKGSDDEHVCHQDDIDTMKLIKADSKGCPSCGMLISKVSGCPQMWCPSCHTAFNWNTLTIETGVIHNPHFFEFQRRNNIQSRAHGDIPCGGRPTPHEVVRSKLLPYQQQSLINYLRNLAHIDGHVLTWLLRNRAPVDNRALRIQYMMNEITEEQFKISLQKREKERVRNQEIRDIIRMALDTAGDMLRACVIHPETYQETITLMENLRLYANESFTKIANRYSIMVPNIKMSWACEIDGRKEPGRKTRDFPV